MSVHMSVHMSLHMSVRMSVHMSIQQLERGDANSGGITASSVVVKAEPPPGMHVHMPHVRVRMCARPRARLHARICAHAQRTRTSATWVQVRGATRASCAGSPSGTRRSPSSPAHDVHCMHKTEALARPMPVYCWPQVSSTDLHRRACT